MSCAPRRSPAPRCSRSRGELRGRAERAERGLDAARSERGLDAARAELARVRQEPRAANVGVSGRSGRFAACRRVTAEPERVPPGGQRVDQLVEGRPSRQGHYARPVSVLHRLGHPADQPPSRARRGVCLGLDDLPCRRDQPGVGPPGRLQVGTARWSTRPHSPCRAYRARIRSTVRLVMAELGGR